MESCISAEARENNVTGQQRGLLLSLAGILPDLSRLTNLMALDLSGNPQLTGQNVCQGPERDKVAVSGSDKGIDCTFVRQTKVLHGKPTFLCEENSFMSIWMYSAPVRGQDASAWFIGPANPQEVGAGEDWCFAVTDTLTACLDERFHAVYSSESHPLDIAIVEDDQKTLQNSWTQERDGWEVAKDFKLTCHSPSLCKPGSFWAVSFAQFAPNIVSPEQCVDCVGHPGQ